MNWRRFDTGLPEDNRSDFCSKGWKDKDSCATIFTTAKRTFYTDSKKDWSVAGAGKGKGTGDLGNGFLCDELAGDNGFKRLQDCWFYRQ